MVWPDDQIKDGKIAAWPACVHEWAILKRRANTVTPRMDRYFCSKCESVMWVEIGQKPKSD